MDNTRRKMEEMEDDDVIIFSYATLILVCAVDMLSNEKIEKKNQEIEKRGWKIGFVRGIHKELKLTFSEIYV